MEELVYQPIFYQELETAYRQMAQDQEREAEALEWTEALLGDGSEPWGE